MRSIGVYIYSPEGVKDPSLSFEFDASNITIIRAEELAPRIAYARAALRQTEQWLDALIEVSREPRARAFIKEAKS